MDNAKAGKVQTGQKQTLLVGTSHAEVVAQAHATFCGRHPLRLRTILLHDPRYQPWGDWQGDDYIVNPA